jgi:hypothetical protein
MIAKKGPLLGSYGLCDSPPVQDKDLVMYINCLVTKVKHGKNQ